MRASWIDQDDAPALGADFFARAKLHKAGKPVRGRPKLANRKQAVSLRLDPDVVAAYKAKGPGWQSLINADLRKAAGLLADEDEAPKRKSPRRAGAAKEPPKHRRN
jgi:uncharacterized protein (DUF4415 family)